MVTFTLAEILTLLDREAARSRRMERAASHAPAKGTQALAQAQLIRLSAIVTDAAHAKAALRLDAAA